MCVVSNVGDFFGNRWDKPYTFPSTGTPQTEWNPVTRREFEELKKEVEEMKRLLTMAKEIDEKTGQASCQMEDKVATLRKVAEMVGVDLEDLLD